MSKEHQALTKVTVLIISSFQYLITRIVDTPTLLNVLIK